jgi:hypothetical protein
MELWAPLESDTVKILVMFVVPVFVYETCWDPLITGEFQVTVVGSFDFKVVFPADMSIQET